MQEIWRDIKDFEGLYKVSNLGNVKALERYVLNNGGLQHRCERILKPQASKGYYNIVLCKNGKTYSKAIHRLVAEAFIPNIDNKLYVDHIDTNPSNNVVTNLRWVTQQENARNPLTRKHISESKVGHSYWGRKLTAEECKKISNALKGRKLSTSHKKKLSDAHTGSVRSEETKKKIAQTNTGHPVSDETKQKIRNKLTGVHKGKHWKLEGGKRIWY